MDGDILRPRWPCFQFQRLGLSDEIPSVVVDSFETVGWTAHVTWCVVCVVWTVQNELSKLLISPSVLFLCYCYV